MKKAFALTLLLLTAAAIITGCIGSHTPAFVFDHDGNYTGFPSLPVNYTAEDAQRDGFYVSQDSKPIANREAWDSFVRDSSQGKNSSVRIAQFYTDNPAGPFFLDLYYRDGSYYLFDSSADDLKKRPYPHLLTLKGQFGNPKRDSGVVVLANDNTLTFDSVMRSMVSSSMEDIKSVPEFQLIMFT